MSGDTISGLIMFCVITAAVSWLFGKVAWENFKPYHWVFKVISVLATIGIFYFIAYGVLVGGK